jgi:hypothetical protein
MGPSWHCIDIGDTDFYDGAVIIRKHDLKKASPLINLELKVERAAGHLDELDAELQKLFMPEPYTITRQDYPKKFRHVIRIQTKAIPPEIALLVGEFAYCLRSGLDQLAWKLAKLHVPCPRRPTSFPIRDDPKADFGDAARDILPAALDVIKEFQPYRRGARLKDHPLWILNRLCTIDKHRTLALKETEISGRVVSVDPSRPPSSDDYTIRHFDYGIEVWISLSDKYKLDFKPQPMEIIFGEPIPSCYGAFQVRGSNTPHRTRIRARYDNPSVRGLL